MKFNWKLLQRYQRKNNHQCLMLLLVAYLALHAAMMIQYNAVYMHPWGSMSYGQNPGGMTQVTLKSTSGSVVSQKHQEALLREIFQSSQIKMMPSFIAYIYIAQLCIILSLICFFRLQRHGAITISIDTFVSTSPTNNNVMSGTWQALVLFDQLCWIFEFF